MMSLGRPYIVPPLSLAVGLLLSGCATVARGPGLDNPAAPLTATATHGDPLERFNRLMFHIGVRLDAAIARPLANGYQRVTPAPARRVVHNVLQNLGQPVVFANDVLQVRPVRAARTAARFVSNSTIGLAGMFDVAARAGLPQEDNDFGATLARYGVGPGPYLYVPLLGPTNARDLVGRGVDVAADPFSWTHARRAQAFDFARTGLSLADDRLNADADLTALHAGAADPYATVRAVYQQARAAELKGGETTLEALPELTEDAAAGVADAASPPSDPATSSP